MPVVNTFMAEGLEAKKLLLKKNQYIYLQDSIIMNLYGITSNDAIRIRNYEADRVMDSANYESCIKLAQDLNKQMHKENNRKKTWRTVAIITGGAAVLETAYLLLKK